MLNFPSAEHPTHFCWEHLWQLECIFPSVWLNASSKYQTLSQILWYILVQYYLRDVSCASILNSVNLNWKYACFLTKRAFNSQLMVSIMVFIDGSIILFIDGINNAVHWWFSTHSWVCLLLFTLIAPLEPNNYFSK